MRTLSVLLAEDNLVGRKIAGKILESLSCSVDFAEDGVEAVEKAASRQYDIILMDMVMPEMNGGDASAAIRARGISTPIVAMSANILSKEQIEKYGMDGSIPKPFNRNDIAEALRKYGHEC